MKVLIWYSACITSILQFLIFLAENKQTLEPN